MTTPNLACIFCNSDASQSNCSHLIPESFGGEVYPPLPPGITCTNCNQYFGSKIEEKALNSFPFFHYRMYLGIPSKKGKIPTIQSVLGKIRASPVPGKYTVLEPSEEFLNLAQGSILEEWTHADFVQPVFTCRMLLKIAIEYLAVTSPALARSEAMDETRKFARFAPTGMSWWFCLHFEHQRFFDFRSSQKMRWDDWICRTYMTHQQFGEAGLFKLKFPFMSFLFPTRRNTRCPYLDMNLSEPDHRIVTVTA